MKNILVTTSWDDGHTLDFKVTELLKKYNLTGTFYISPKDREIPENERLTDSQIVELSKGFEIGAHTMTHPRLSFVSDDEARKEIVDSKSYLENVLGKKVISFCYPGGVHEEKHKKMVEDAGFTFARNVETYSFCEKQNKYSFPTTVHAYRHWSGLLNIYKHLGLKNILRNFLNWDQLAIAMFEKVRVNGGVYHLWGHSWEINNNKDWQRLENVFKYISNIEGVKYVTNGEII